MKPDSVRRLVAIHDLVTELLSAPDRPAADIMLGEMWNHLVVVKKDVELDRLDAIDMTSEEVETMRSGRVINAIKDVRSRTGMGLRDAKELVERTGDKLGLRDPNASFGNHWKIQLRP